MLEFSREKVVGKAVVEINITENDIETIIVNGFEGGIYYWAGLDSAGKKEWEEKPRTEPSSTWATKLLLEGKIVTLYDIEDEDEKWDLTLNKLIKGFEINAKKRPHDADLEQGDASTADCIIQYALFGKLVYG